MSRRALALCALLLLPLTSACAQAQDLASRAQDCAGLAQDVASSGLSGVPSQAEAEQAVDRLDNRIEQLDNDEVKQAAGTLRDRLRDVQEAVASGDTASAQQAVTEARAAARAAADECGVPVDQFLGG
jgi:TolA-binding protein